MESLHPDSTIYVWFIFDCDSDRESDQVPETRKIERAAVQHGRFVSVGRARSIHLTSTGPFCTCTQYLIDVTSDPGCCRLYPAVAVLQDTAAHATAYARNRESALACLQKSKPRILRTDIVLCLALSPAPFSISALVGLQIHRPNRFAH